MSFICPHCKQGTLAITGSAELGPDDQYDEISFQAAYCQACSFSAVALYKESRRGSTDSFHHYGYPVTEIMYGKACDDINNKSVKNYNEYLQNDDEPGFHMKYKE